MSVCIIQGRSWALLDFTPNPPENFRFLDSRRCILVYISRPLGRLYHNQNALIFSSFSTHENYSIILVVKLIL